MQSAFETLINVLNAVDAKIKIIFSRCLLLKRRFIHFETSQEKLSQHSCHLAFRKRRHVWTCVAHGGNIKWESEGRLIMSYAGFCLRKDRITAYLANSPPLVPYFYFYVPPCFYLFEIRKLIASNVLASRQITRRKSIKASYSLGWPFLRVISLLTWPPLLVGINFPGFSRKQ